MIKTSITLQELRRKIYVKAKADKSHRFWLTKKIRRHLMRAKGKQGFGWKQWSTKGLYAKYNIYSNFKVSPRKFVPT